MNREVELGPVDRDETRPFAHLEHNDDDYGNLVLMAQPDYNEHWRTSPRHAFASRVIAPQYYATVRLHVGRLPGGLYSGHAPVLTRTKYYDFRGDWHWSAVREYGAH